MCMKYRKGCTYVTKIHFIRVGRMLAFQKSAIRMQHEILYPPMLGHFA